MKELKMKCLKKYLNTLLLALLACLPSTASATNFNQEQLNDLKIFCGSTLFGHTSDEEKEMFMLYKDQLEYFYVNVLNSDEERSIFSNMIIIQMHILAMNLEAKEIMAPFTKNIDKIITLHSNVPAANMFIDFLNMRLRRAESKEATFIEQLKKAESDEAAMFIKQLKIIAPIQQYIMGKNAALNAVSEAEFKNAMNIAAKVALEDNESTATKAKFDALAAIKTQEKETKDALAIIETTFKKEIPRLTKLIQKQIVSGKANNIL
jgi:hypothetical protein